MGVASITRAPTTETVWFGDGCVVFDRASNTVRRLNATAATIWRTLEETSSRADLISMVLDRTPGHAPDAPGEVRAFCDELASWGLIVEAAQ